MPNPKELLNKKAEAARLHLDRYGGRDHACALDRGACIHPVKATLGHRLLLPQVVTYNPILMIALLDIRGCKGFKCQAQSGTQIFPET